MVLIEPTGKRCRFLEAVTGELGLEGVEIVNARAEDYAKEHRGEFDVVTARAVANLRVLSELCVPLVKVNGMFVAMKGQAGMAEHREAEKALRVLGAELKRQKRQRWPQETAESISGT